MDETYRQYCYSDADGPSHPELSDDQSAEDRGDSKTDPVYHTDEPVRFRSFVRFEEERYHCRESDHTDIADNHTDEYEEYQTPERNTRERYECRLRVARIDESYDTETYERYGTGYCHDVFFLMMIDNGAEIDT